VAEAQERIAKCEAAYRLSHGLGRRV
jgi:hypothetical protein